MNERQISYMLTILREGSISKAAEKLYISQPSLSQTVRKVEEEVGVEIFERYTTPITLTPAGEIYVRSTREIKNIYENMVKEIADLKAGERGSIHFGLPFQRELEVLPTFFPEFHRTHPNIELKIEEHGSGTLEQMLLNRQLDFAFVTTSPKLNGLNYILVAKEEIVLLAAKTTALAQRIPDGTRISIAEAANEKFIAIKSGHSVRMLQEQLFASLHPAPEVLLEIGMIEVGKHVVPTSDAVMLTPRNYIDVSPELKETCNVYPVRGVDLDRHFYICHRKDQYLTHYAKDLIHMFVPAYDFDNPSLSFGEEIVRGEE